MLYEGCGCSRYHLIPGPFGVPRLRAAFFIWSHLFSCDRRMVRPQFRVVPGKDVTDPGAGVSVEGITDPGKGGDPDIVELQLAAQRGDVRLHGAVGADEVARHQLREQPTLAAR